MTGKHRFHFVGIGGIGMSAIARLLAAKGHRVSGSDIASSALTEELQKLGVRIQFGHQKEAVHGADRVVYSSSIREDNSEILEAKRLGIEIWHRSRALVEASRGLKMTAVSGTHGKSTTTAMLGKIFQSADRNPTVLVGAKVPEFGSNVAMGSGSDVIIEADESDASFLAYQPSVIVTTNIDWDHVDRFASLEEVRDIFERFIDRLEPGGFWVACSESGPVREILTQKRARSVTYGWSRGNDYRIGSRSLCLGKGSRFEVIGPGGPLGEVELKLFGEHNILNALGACAAALEQGVPFKAVQRGLSEFKGAYRRFDVKFDDGCTAVVDDYAHHPAEIQATLKAAANFSDRPVTAVFQPHRYSRLAALEEQFASSFAGASRVLVTDVYAAHEDPMEGVSGRHLAERITKMGGLNCEYVPRMDLGPRLECLAGEAGLFLIMGAGDVSQESDRLKKYLTQKNGVPSAR